MIRRLFVLWMPLVLVALAAGAALHAQGPPGTAKDSAAKRGAAGSDTAAGAVVVLYHRFGEGEYPTTSIRLEQFEAHLAELRNRRYTVWPLPRIVEALRSGTPLPERTVAISIDDAYRSVYTQAWPRLKAAGLPFTVFVATEAVDRGYTDLMRWDELRELVASGLVTLGNHSVTHPHMIGMAPSAIRREFREASRRIAAETGTAPTVLAYPYGEFSRQVRKIAEEEGFDAAFGQQSGAIDPGADRYALPRFALNEAYGDMPRFVTAVNALPLPVREVIPDDWVLTDQQNPPLFGLTLVRDSPALADLTCYVGGQKPLRLRKVGPRRGEGRPERPFPVGRSRINCTAKGPDGRWYWYGAQFYLPPR